jgi:hypothetical protein
VIGPRTFQREYATSQHFIFIFIETDTLFAFAISHFINFTYDSLNLKEGLTGDDVVVTGREGRRAKVRS